MLDDQDNLIRLIVASFFLIPMLWFFLTHSFTEVFAGPKPDHSWMYQDSSTKRICATNGRCCDFLVDAEGGIIGRADGCIWLNIGKG